MTSRRIVPIASEEDTATAGASPAASDNDDDVDGYSSSVSYTTSEEDPGERFEQWRRTLTENGSVVVTGEHCTRTITDEQTLRKWQADENAYVHRQRRRRALRLQHGIPEPSSSPSSSSSGPGRDDGGSAQARSPSSNQSDGSPKMKSKSGGGKAARSPAHDVKGGEEPPPDFPYRCDVDEACTCFVPNLRVAKPLECARCGYARWLHNVPLNPLPTPPSLLLPRCAKPKLHPKHGTHTNAQDELRVTVSCATPGAKIWVTLDRSTPCSNTRLDTVYDIEAVAQYDAEHKGFFEERRRKKEKQEKQRAKQRAKQMANAEQTQQQGEGEGGAAGAGAGLALVTASQAATGSGDAAIDGSDSGSESEEEVLPDPAITLTLGTTMVRAYATCDGYQPSDVAQGEYTLVEWVDEALLKQEMLEAAVRARKWRRRPGGFREIINALMRKAARKWMPEPQGFLLKYVYDQERYRLTRTFGDEKLGMEFAFVGSEEAKAAGIETTLADYPGVDSETLVIVSKLVRVGDRDENERANTREQDMILEAERRGVVPGEAILLLGEKDVTKWHVNRITKEVYRMAKTKRKDAVITFLQPHVREDNKIDIFMKTERKLNWRSLKHFDEDYQAASVLSPVEVSKNEGAKLLVQFYLTDELELYGRRLRQREDLERYIKMMLVWGIDLEKWFRVSSSEVRARRTAKMLELKEAAEEERDGNKRRIKKAQRRAREGMVFEDKLAEELRAAMHDDVRAQRAAILEKRRQVAALRKRQKEEHARRLSKAGLKEQVHEINSVTDGVWRSQIYMAARRRFAELQEYPGPPPIPEGGFELEPGQEPTPASAWIEVETEVDEEKRSYWYDPLTFKVTWEKPTDDE